MKRNLSLIINLALLIALVFSAVACGGSAAMSSSPKPPLPPDRSGASAGDTYGSFNQPLAMATAGTIESPELKYGTYSENARGSIESSPPTQYQSSLTAGQVDDNAKFSDYLDYLSKYQGPIASPIPVAQRIFVRVVDGEQHPVAGARVQLFDGDRAVFDGGTVSDGRILFLPEAANATQAQQFRAIISRGQQQVEATVKAGVLDQTVALNGITDNKGAVGIDVVFLLDATGSMGDELDKIKATVGSVASRIEQLPGSSSPRFGLVAYQDHGDNFVTKSWDFAGVDEFSLNLSSIHEGGGGDYPEAVNEGLRDAINLQGWADNSTGRHLRLIVLVGDAPPHLDYVNDPAYPDLLRQAAAKDIKIFPIGASGLDDQGEYIFRQFAQITQGQFVFLTYENGVSGAPGMGTNHSVSNFTVQDLDTLVVNLVASEVANQTGNRNQSYSSTAVSSVVPVGPAQRSWLASIFDSLRAFTDSAVSWNTAFWLLVLCVLLLWVRRSPNRARLSLLRPRRQLAPEEGDDILIPEITFDGTPAIVPPHNAHKVHLKARFRGGEREQPTLPLPSLPPDVAARVS